MDSGTLIQITWNRKARWLKTTTRCAISTEPGKFQRKTPHQQSLYLHITKAFANN
jgi:hypothetical protein